MPRKGVKIIAALVIAVAAISCGDDTSTNATAGPTFMRIRLQLTNPADTIFVRRYADCTVFDSASVGGAFTQVPETLRVNVGAPATITASLSDNLGVADPVGQSGAYKFVVVGMRSKVGALTWNSTGMQGSMAFGHEFRRTLRMLDSASAGGRYDPSLSAVRAPGVVREPGRIGAGQGAGAATRCPSLADPSHPRYDAR